MENFIQAENGEKVNIKEAEELAKRVRKLPSSKIDELWFRFSATEPNSGNKALSKNSLNKIIADQETATRFVVNLLKETGKSGSLKDLKTRFRKHLKDLESSKMIKTKSIILSESGEKIKLKEAEELAIRIRRLSAVQIDELWFTTGFIYSNSGNKALPTKTLNKILIDQDYATSCVVDLLEECGRLPGSLDKLRREFIGNLEKIESKNDSKMVSREKEIVLELVVNGGDTNPDWNDLDALLNVLSVHKESMEILVWIARTKKKTKAWFPGSEVIEVKFPKKLAKQLFDLLDEELAKWASDTEKGLEPSDIGKSARDLVQTRLRLMHELGMLPAQKESGTWRSP